MAMCDEGNTLNAGGVALASPVQGQATTPIQALAEPVPPKIQDITKHEASAAANLRRTPESLESRRYPELLADVPENVEGAQSSLALATADP
jgi:hypothetical protein